MSAQSTRKQRRAEPARPSRGRADIERIRTMSDAEVDSTSPPELKDLPPDLWNDAVVVPRRPNDACYDFFYLRHKARKGKLR